MVLCVEPAGEVQVEAATVTCCAAQTSPSHEPATLAPAVSPEPEHSDSCGPCTDTPLPPAPTTRPPENEHVGDITCPCMSLTFDHAAPETAIVFTNRFVVADAALIPVKTTTLLI